MGKVWVQWEVMSSPQQLQGLVLEPNQRRQEQLHGERTMQQRTLAEATTRKRTMRVSLVYVLLVSCEVQVLVNSFYVALCVLSSLE